MFFFLWILLQGEELYIRLALRADLYLLSSSVELLFHRIPVHVAVYHLEY